MLIAFAGPIGVGKSEAAKMVKGAIIMSFATPLKNAAKELFGFTTQQLYTLEGKQEVDPRWGVTPREMLHWLGTDVMRKRFPGFWVKRMEYALQDINSPGHIVIDDCRFPDEAAMVRRLGGTVVHVHGRQPKIEVDTRTVEHEAEKPLEIFSGDLSLDNSGDLTLLKRRVAELVRYIQS